MVKQGICIDCGPDSKPTYLTAKRCKNHYWKHRAEVNAAKRKDKPEVNDLLGEKKALNSWFATQISMMPKYCENCGDYLNQYAPWGARAYVCHIVPKAHFETVKLHPLNRWFGCIQCHGDYDNRGADKVAEMPVIKIVQDRFNKFSHLLNDDEFKRLPIYLMIEI
jgi:hypothetical protein